MEKLFYVVQRQKIDHIGSELKVSTYTELICTTNKLFLSIHSDGLSLKI